jgi:1-deoxy-D-xylulose-5-phosphate synthase
LSLLEKINSPADLKRLAHTELLSLADEIRQLLISRVSENGGHLASNLGVVELTLALHRIFDSPRDKIIWDVGHQTYTHKLITGRREQFATLRQSGGLSGFPVRSESEHDAFGTGHAGTSISAALGMALARDLTGSDHQVVAVIGDGSLGTGMALEAVNHVGNLGTHMTVILNDNGIAISPTVGAIARLLNRVRFDPGYQFAKKRVKRTVFSLPFGKAAWQLTRRIKGYMAGVVLPNTFWEELGFVYLGPVDGYNIREMEAAFRRARDESGPVLVHVITAKG